jgi:hypothetical protein
METRKEGFCGIGRRERRNMIRRWKSEGHGMSLKQWARLAKVGEAATAWLETKRKGSP